MCWPASITMGSLCGPAVALLAGTQRTSDQKGELGSIKKCIKHQGRAQTNIMFVWCKGYQGCICCGTCSYLELTEDHVLTSAYVKIFRIVTRNAVNKSFWRKKDCSWPPLNKYAMNIWLSSLKIRAHLSWRTGKHLHVLHVLRTYPTCSYPGYQDTTTYAALLLGTLWYYVLQERLWQWAVPIGHKAYFENFFVLHQ